METPAVAQFLDVINLFSTTFLADLADVLVSTHDTTPDVAPFDKEEDRFQADRRAPCHPPAREEQTTIPTVPTVSFFLSREIIPRVAWIRMGRKDDLR